MRPSNNYDSCKDIEEAAVERNLTPADPEAEQDEIAEITASVAESEPLLRSATTKFDIEALRAKALRHPPVSDYTYVDFENMPWYMFLRHFTGAMLQVSIVMGAYFFMQSNGHEFTPTCQKYHGPQDQWTLETERQRLDAFFCYVTTLSFWTYPLVCPLFVLVVYYKNLLDKRLFYECLMHRVFLIYTYSSYLFSPTFWFLCIYLVSGLLSLIYIRDSPAWHDRPLSQLISALLAYLSPTFAFLVSLFTRWTPNSYLASLPQYFYQDHEKSLDLLNECQFVRATDFRMAFWQAEEMIEKIEHEENITVKLNTGELITLIHEFHLRRFRVSSLWHEFACSCRIGRKAYWVAQILFYDRLRDERSWRFSCYASLYMAIIAIAAIEFVWAMGYTIQEFLEVQGSPPLDIIPPPEVIMSRGPHNNSSAP